jgi:hypothetical protein
VTALYNEANSDISSHHNVTEMEAGNNEGNQWEQENRVSENNKTSARMNGKCGEEKKQAAIKR